MIEENGSNRFFSRVRIYSQKYTIRLTDSNILRFNMYICIYLFIDDLLFWKNCGLGVFIGILLKKLLFWVDDFNLKLFYYFSCV